MPELPEVEVVRRGLDSLVLGQRVLAVDVRHPRAIRRHEQGVADFVATLRGCTLTATGRRGKFLWLTTDHEDVVLAAHLGMSGQFRVGDVESSTERHTRVRLSLERAELRFVDQRTFGWLAARPLVTDRFGVVVPDLAAEIAPDPSEAVFDLAGTARELRRHRVEIKRLLLDQSLVSGVGNIYADEALWAAGVHPQRRADRMSQRDVAEVLASASAVMAASLAQGGTSFDELYVDVNGASGYYGRGLSVYGREGRPCPRCASPIIRLRFTNRSSHVCPTCQVAPRAPH